MINKVIILYNYEIKKNFSITFLIFYEYINNRTVRKQTIKNYFKYKVSLFKNFYTTIIIHFIGRNI